jgi:hypothetical protein
MIKTGRRLTLNRTARWCEYFKQTKHVRWNVNIRMDTRRCALLIVIPLAISIVSFGLAYIWLTATDISDIYLRLCIARSFLTHSSNPYSTCMVYNFGQPAAEYPLTTILLLAPFSLLSDRLAASLFWGLSNGLLMFGILHQRQLRYLLIFTSGPYWAAFIWQQYSVFIAAVMLLPTLLPLALIKPQLGLPVILTNLSRKRLIACVMFVTLTFIVYPGWLFDWYGRSNQYNGVSPLLILPLGPLLFFTLLKWRDKNALFLFLMACVPQRTIMDTVALFLVPQTTRRLALLCILSWVPATMFILNPVDAHPEIAMPYLQLFIYLPLLVMIMHVPPQPGNSTPKSQG